MRTPVEKLIAWIDAAVVAYRWNCLRGASFWSWLTGRDIQEAAKDAAHMRGMIQAVLLEFLECLETGATSPDVIDAFKSARHAVAEWKVT